MTASQVRAFQVCGPGHGDIVPVDVAKPGCGEVRVRTCYSGISRGTERLVFTGRVPASEYRRMRAPFQRGEFPAPVTCGYSSVGVVEEGAAEWIGRYVFCLYPHQTHYVVPSDAIHPLPAGLPPERAVLAANMETAVNAMWDLGPRVGDRISIVGAGTIGCLVAALSTRVPGARVELIDVEPARSAIAERLGVEFRSPADAGDDRDLVVHASASEAGLRRALDLAGTEATILELSWFGNADVRLPLGEAFHSRRLQLRSSQVGHVAPARASRRSPGDRLALALELLTDPVFDCLIDAESEFSELPAVMTAIAAGQGGAFCHRIRYDTGSGAG